MWYSYAFVFTIAFIVIVTYILQKINDTRSNKIIFYYRFFIFYLWISVVATMAIPYSLLRPKHAGNMKKFIGLVKYVDKLLNLKYQIRDIKFLSEDGGAVIVANHESTLDSIVVSHLAVKVKYNLTFIMKKEIIYWGPFGLCAYLGGTIFIDRNNPRNAYNLLQATKDHMIKEKNKIWMFPEGTRNKDTTKLLPFKKGAFNIAVETQAPILPVVISPYYFINRKKYTFSKGHIIVQCLEPVPTTGLTINDVPDLVEHVHAKMAVAYNTLCKEIVSP